MHHFDFTTTPAAWLNNVTNRHFMGTSSVNEGRRTLHSEMALLIDGRVVPARGATELRAVRMEGGGRYVVEMIRTSSASPDQEVRETLLCLGQPR